MFYISVYALRQIPLLFPVYWDEVIVPQSSCVLFMFLIGEQQSRNLKLFRHGADLPSGEKSMK